MAESFLSPSWHRVNSLRPRLRTHVQVHRHRYRGQAWYVVQDDVAGRFHRFTSPVYLFVGQMDGRRTVDELWKAVVTQLGDDAPTQGEIIRLLSQLHAADIMQCDVSPDAAELFDRHAAHSRTRLRQRLGNPMSIKFRLVDPDRFLERTVRYLAPLFGWTGALLWLAAVLSATVLAGMYWPELSENVADRTLALENLILMACVFPVLKAFHELGHGYATRHFGGEVHEFGLMFLVFAPVPYCDASSSAAFRGKWQRALVGAAGMIVELFIAALAVFVWVLVEPGPVRAVCYNVMLIAGVSTIVFNANPLLRFDGYYILCDLLEIPNLGARANRYWRELIEHRVFGVADQPADVSPGERIWFILYAPAAYIYRLMVMFGIALFVVSEFFVVGILIAIWSVTVGLVWPVVKGLKNVMAGPRLREKRMRAVGLTLGAVATVAAVLLLVPVPLHTSAEGVIWLPDDGFVRAATDGFVKRLMAQSGDSVAPGAALVELEEPSLVSEMSVLRAQVVAAVAKVEAEQFNDRVQADLARQELQLRQSGLDRATEKVDQLMVRSGAAGTLIVPRETDMPGRFFKRGDVLGYVTGPEARMLRVVVLQADIELVRQHLTGAQVKFPDRPGETFTATVIREVPAGSDKLPSKALTEAGGGRLAVDPRDPNQLKTLQRTFQFDLALPVAAPAQFGERALVRFAHGNEPLGWQWYRRIRQLFLARLNA
jgi:putative peptide zinc metalloprotease protein